MIPLYLLILLPILFGVINYLLHIPGSKILYLFFQVFLTIQATLLFFAIKNNGLITHTLGGWNAKVGIMLRADALASVMVMLTTFLFLFMFIFNLKKEYMNNLFLFLFIVLEGLMIGVLLSNDFFNVFILIEVSTVVVSILIMFKKDSRSIYDGMLYLLVNIVSMTFFLFGTGMLYKLYGVLDFNLVMKGVGHSSPNSLFLPYAFIITAVSLKTALMPLFSWLPRAHGTPSAPSIVSAVLSGLYVKNGVYLFIRMQQIFGHTIDISEFFLVVGVLTAIIGSIIAFCQSDLKLILAYSTVSQIGLIMVGLNTGYSQAYWGSIYHIINHALFKSTLFLTAGMIIEEYRTRKINEIRGVLKRMPIIATATILAVLGIIGTPFFNASISKYLIAYGMTNTLSKTVFIIINFFTIVIFIRYTTILFGKSKQKVFSKEKDFFRRGVVIIMGFMCLIGGLFGQQMINFLFNQEISIGAVEYINKGIMFGLTLVAGILLYYFFLRKLRISGKLGRFEMSFNNICLSITGFFVIILLYLNIKY